MCSATDGATPVRRWTMAASSIFSYGVRAALGFLKTLKRVPVLPYAHDGVSIHCWRKACLISLLDAIAVSSGHLRTQPKGHYRSVRSAAIAPEPLPPLEYRAARQQPTSP